MIAISGGAMTAPSGSRIDHAHRQRAVMRRKPLGNRARRRWESITLAGPQQQAACSQSQDTTRQPVARAGQRPEDHDGEKNPRLVPIRSISQPPPVPLS
jgi:hypothetical protein